MNTGQQAWIVLTMTSQRFPILSYGPFTTIKDASIFAEREFSPYIRTMIVPTIPTFDVAT